MAFIYSTRSSPYSILEPIKIVKSESEYILVEQSINSTRISFKLKQADEIERLLVVNFAKFLMHRAETLLIIRRIPIKVSVVWCVFIIFIIGL